MSPSPDFTQFWLPLFLPLLLVGAVYRLTRLVVKDTFPPVLWLRDRLAGGWRPATAKDHRYLQSEAYRQTPALERPSIAEIGGTTNVWVERASWSPDWLAELLTCPWCASGWITGVVVAVTDVTYGLPVPWLMGPAVWGAAALLASQEWA